MINQLAEIVHKNARKKGFYEEEKKNAEMLMLIVSEASEALEADRKGIAVPKSGSTSGHSAGDLVQTQISNPLSYQINAEDFKTAFIKDIKDTFEDELADIVIRVMDLAAYRGIDLENHIKAKMRYNSYREYKHGKKY